MKKAKLINTLVFITKVLYDLLALAVTIYLSAFCSGLHGSLAHVIQVAYPLAAISMVAIFYLMCLYQFTYRYADIAELIKTVVGSALFALCYLIPFSQFVTCNLSFVLLFGSLFILLMILGRFSIRAIYTISYYISRQQTKDRIPIMIVGGGEAGMMLMREIEHGVKYWVTCIVDDDPAKRGKYIKGVKVRGNRKDIPTLAKKYGVAEIIISMPAASGEAIREISEICKVTGCKVKTLPGLYQLVDGGISLSRLRDVSIEDLLAREPIRVNIDKVMEYVNDKVVLVTGGGGSIGSELCRQIAAHHPHQLIILDIYENNAYDIQQELVKKYPTLNLVTVIASVRDKKRLEHIFAFYRPQLIYHAAAHKHVPLMEESPNEAIKNNVFGTLYTAQMADQFGVERFVMISTDKAVNPTNVMGATKRICEMIIQSFQKRSKTEFVAVRFGNVLGSNGSVIPLFKKQIQAGGPVCVTHPEIIRYFMTISEAVSLVLQAGAFAKGGEIFILDMGKPVKILDLAENLIRLSGYEPYREIDIKFTGLRPGEKLYEEMLMSEEGMLETENKLIHIGKPIEFDDEEFFRQLEELEQAVAGEPDNARAIISVMVPTYMGNKEIKNI